MKKILSALLVLAALAGCLSLTACGSSAGGGKTVTLNVYNWGEYISDGSEGSLNVNKEFERYYYETYGESVRVNYTTYASNEDMYNKLRSGATTYDVIIPSDYMIERMIKEDMLRPLNYDEIPNFEYINEDYRNLFYDPENRYSVPYTYGMVGLIYNEDMVDGEITSWSSLWDEQYSGQILQFNNARDAFGTAMYWAGIDVNTTNHADWDKAKELLRQQKPLVQSYVMDEIFNKMKSNSAAIAPYYAGDYLTMSEDNEALRFVYPEEGTNVFVDAMCVPTCSAHPEIAERYINFMLSEDIAVANAEYIGYASPNRLVYENEDYMADMQDIHEDAMEILYPSAENTVFTSYYQNLDQETLDYENMLWESLKIENSIEPWIYVVSGLIVFGVIALLIFRVARKAYREKYYYAAALKLDAASGGKKHAK